MTGLSSRTVTREKTIAINKRVARTNKVKTVRIKIKKMMTASKRVIPKTEEGKAKRQRP